MTAARLVRLIALMSLAAPFQAAAQHFARAYVDVTLVGRDSIVIEVSADRQDMMNTVGTFPDRFAPGDPEFYRVYQQRLEAYLQSRVLVRADGKAVRLAAVRWKAGGAGRDDGLDSLSLWHPFHLVGLGGKLPAGAASLTIRNDLWIERPDRPRVTMLEYAFLEGDRALRRAWMPTERTIRFPLGPDSLEVMRKTPPAPGSPRTPVDHSGHGH